MLFDDTDEMTGWERFVAEEAVVKAAADKLVQAIVRDDPKVFREAAWRLFDYDDGWNYVLEKIVRVRPPISRAIRRQLLDVWARRGPAIRRGAYSDALLADGLRVILGEYRGPARRLYRGEDPDDHRRGEIGIAWTKKRRIAGLFAEWKEGVVLETVAPRQAILGKVHSWSKQGLYEHEYLVDPRLLRSVSVAQEWPIRKPVG